MPSKRPWKASEWLVASENALKVFRAHELKVLFARNVQNECAGVSQREPACHMTVTCGVLSYVGSVSF